MLFRFIILSLSLFVCSISHAKALDKRTVCTWDPVGKNGPVVAFFADLIPIAQTWGLDLTFVPYADENQVAIDLKDNKCDIGIVTAILSRDFVQFAGTLDAIGGITSERKLIKTLAAISSPKAVKLMSEGDYEVVASLPVGSMFAFVNDREISSIDKFRGRTLGVLNDDIQTRMFAELSGATPVDVTLSNFSEYFKNGDLDIVLMPALAYNTFELYKGLGEKGGIIDIRLFYGMLQAISHKSAFNDDFGTKMRRYMLERMNNISTMISNAEKQIPKSYWIRTDSKTKEDLEDFYKNIRLALKVIDRFDARALSLLWKIRCHTSPDREECEMPK